jgi:hypothetical protein
VFARIQLPVTQASLFRDARQLDAPDAGADAVSERFRIPILTRVLRGPRWGVNVGNEFVARYDGAWDIGALDVRLARPVLEQVVSRRGLLSAGPITLETEFSADDGEEGCADGFTWSERQRAPVPDRLRVKDPLFSFLVPAALPMHKVSIRSKAVTLPIDPNAPLVEAEQALKKLVLHLADLDQDGRPDFAFIEGWRKRPISEVDGAVLRLLLVNVGGQWRLLATDRYDECA